MNDHNSRAATERVRAALERGERLSLDDLLECDEDALDDVHAAAGAEHEGASS